MDLSGLFSTTSQANQPPESHPFLHNRYFVEGVITGACACPEIPLPDTWLPWTIKAHHQIKDNAQADYIFEQLFAYFKDVLSKMKDAELRLPDYAVYKEVDTSTALNEYCQGLMFAHQSCEATWQQAWARMQQAVTSEEPRLAKDLKHCLLVFSTFAEPAVAIAQAKERGEEDLATKLPIIAKSLPSALDKYVGISGTLAGFLPNQFETFKQ